MDSGKANSTNMTVEQAIKDWMGVSLVAGVIKAL
jgi:hypothetical protein